MGVVKRRHVLVSFTAIVMMVLVMVESVASHNYSVALTKSILFFEGQRSGKIPPTQRLKWRNDSALRDGFEIGVDLVGGYYDAGDNVKFSFPMAFSTTMLAWSVIDFGKNMDTDLKHALEAIHWGTDYLLKATSLPDLVFVQVGDARADHSCWERPEDMGTPRTPYAVSKNFPGSEVSAEIAAALAASSIVFKDEEPHYSKKLLERAESVFHFADKYQGSYNHSLGPWVCPYYCDYSGYQDELVWAAAWLYKATSDSKYMNYIDNNIKKLDNGFAEFGWDSKHAGINVLVGKMLMWKNPDSEIIKKANKFVCSIMPGSPTKKVSYSPGGLIFKRGSSNMQHATALSFLLLTYAQTLHAAYKKVVCGNVVVNTYQIIQLATHQANYILGSNPMKMSYMVGYGNKYPKKIHHRGSSLPSIDHHPKRIACDDGKRLGGSSNGPNPNLLIGAIVGGPHFNDSYSDSRSDFARSEPTTYINAPFVGVLAFLKSPPHSLSV